MNIIKHYPIIILDFGSQYTQLIGRRIRELGIYCEIHPYNAGIELLETHQPLGIILSGGPATVIEAHQPRAPEWVFNCGLPLLGICYGMQLMAHQLGGEVVASPLREFGYASVRLQGHCPLFDGVDKALDVWMSHGDSVSTMPPGFHCIAQTDNTPIAGMYDESRHWYGLQFHPEVTQTEHGLAILNHFVTDICGATADWIPSNIIDESVQSIRQQVGKQRVVLGLSGGVDSSVVALLLDKAIGQQLVCVFVDTGLLRLNEVEQVVAMFKENLNLNLIVVDAADRFYSALQGIQCPEEKRKRIGATFIDVFDEQAKALSDVAFLAQGTIYSDVIESGAVSGNSASEVIKSHHNVGGLPDTMSLKLIEPLRNLFKDEVRKVGLELGLPAAMLYRHPFPGPGLGIRILGEVKPEYAIILRQADAIFIDELNQANLYDSVNQAFAVFLPIRSVGVMGDGRRYDYVICLRAVQTIDFMTAHWAHLPWDFLGKVSNRIINEVPGVSRVTYDISGKPPATIEWE